MTDCCCVLEEKKQAQRQQEFTDNRHTFLCKLLLIPLTKNDRKINTWTKLSTSVTLVLQSLF